MIQLKYSYTVNLDKREDGTARLRFLIYYNNKRISFSVGITVDTDKWDTANQMALPRTNHGKRKTPAMYINGTLQRYRDTADRLFANYAALDITPTHEQIKTDMLTAMGRAPEDSKDTKNPTLERMINDYINEKSTLNQWTIGTLKRHNVIRNKMLRYSPNANVSDIDRDWLMGYYQMLVQKDKLSNNSVKDQLKRANIIFKWADEHGYDIPKDYKTFTPNITTTEKQVVFLEWDELMLLYHYDFPTDRQNNVRDCFCFQCFTSLRYSDLVTLTKTNITPSHIIVTTQKTTDLLYIDLNDYSRAILDRHKDSDSDLALPVPTNQVYNRYLKEICAIAGIDTPVTVTDIIAGHRVSKTYPKYALITSHAGRRTFICTALGLGIPPAIIMQWTGHKDFNAMKPYIGVLDNEKRNSMSRFNLHEKDPRSAND